MDEVEEDDVGEEGTETPSDAGIDAARRVSVGAVLARSFGFYLRHLPALFLIGAVCFLPHLFVQWELVDRLWRGARESEVLAAAWLFLGLAFLLPLFVQGAVTLGVFQHLRGEAVRLPRSIARGVLSLPSLLGVFVLLALALAGALFVGSLPVTLLRSGPNRSEGADLIATLGVLALVAFVLCVYFVAVQAVIVERVGPWRAMGRSRDLTRGARWKIFALLILVVTARWLAGLGLHRIVLGPATSVADVRLYVGVDTVLNVLFATLAAVWTAVLYHDLRRAKEGVSIEDLLKVFE